MMEKDEYWFFLIHTMTIQPYLLFKRYFFENNTPETAR